MMKQRERFLEVPLKSQPVECVILAAPLTGVVDDCMEFSIEPITTDRLANNPITNSNHSNYPRARTPNQA